MIHILSDEWRDCRDRLRKIVIHSADVLPREVAIYLSEVAKFRSWDAKKGVLAGYRLLVDYLPREYVDFALDTLITKPSPRRYPYSYRDEYREDLLGQLGIEDHREFYPAAPIQGPFLYLLHKHEDEGLRLIQTLVNSAVQRWRERTQSRRYGADGLTPLPVVIDLPSGPQEFWGNEQVYYWYRPNSTGPHAVVSALMALEVWMEQHVESGRDPEGLFQKVLAGSHCVAMVAICLGMALAYPEKCLKAALPLVSASAIWRMDVPRAAADLSGSFNFDPLGRHQFIDQLRAERDKRPQRSRDVRSLAVYYVFGADESLRVRFERAVAEFTENLPFLYREEQEAPETVRSLREEMENFQVFGVRANYRQRMVDDHIEIWVESPEHIQARNETVLAQINERQRWLGVDMWARKTVEEGRAAEGMTLEEAVAAAKGFQQPADFTSPYGGGGDAEAWRLQAIAGVAAAVLLTAFDWAQEHGHLPWCREILLAAASMPSRENPMSSRHTIFPSDPRVSAGRGLGALVARGAADVKVREQILELVIDPQLQVVEAVFRGLYDAWAVDELLCWNALSLGLSLCLLPQKLRRYGTRQETQRARWARQLVRKHLNNVKRNAIPQLPRIPITEDIIFLWDSIQRPLCALPFSVLMGNPVTKRQILQLTDDLMAWTVNENTPAPDDPHGYHTHRPYEWNYFFMKWVSHLAESLSLEEAREHILTPIRNRWSHAQGLTADLLEGYIVYHTGFMEPLPPSAQAAWREICNWVLDSPEIAREVRYDFLTSDIADAVSLIVYTRYGGSLLKDEWPHATLFSNIIEKWVEKIGYNPSAYGHLVTMLKGPGRSFSPEPVLEWLNRIVNASLDIHRLLGRDSNGERTAELLMRMWNDAEDYLRNNASSQQRYATIVDRLVSVGVPLASILRQKLENL